MHRSKYLLIQLLLVSAFMFTGCFQNQNPVEPVQDLNHTGTSKLTIPAGAVVDSAWFYVNVTTALSAQVTLHGILNSWDENTVTWNNFAGGFGSTSVGDFTPSVPGWYVVDVSGLVNSWLDSSLANNGILLKEESPAGLQYFASREEGNSPYLKIFWSLNGIPGWDSTTAAADAFIFSGDGDVNYGDSLDLISGWQDTTEYQSLIRFEIERSPVYGGCTHSFGYWKTHSAYGPAPYDSTWALLGEDSTFFLSGKSNYQVLWTPPSHGNAYYMLAHVYIAAHLNFLNGADPTAILGSFNDATALFSVYTPDEIEALRGNDSLRQQFISLKNIIGEYNEGIIGPGSCDSTAADSRVRMK